MYDQQRLRPACAYGQSDQSLCWSLEYSMNFKLLTEQHLEFLSLTGGLHLSKCHIVGDHMSRLKYISILTSYNKGLEVRKPYFVVRKQQRSRPASASAKFCQCFSIPYTQFFYILAMVSELS